MADAGAAGLAGRRSLGQGGVSEHGGVCGDSTVATAGTRVDLSYSHPPWPPRWADVAVLWSNALVSFALNLAQDF